MRDGKAFVWIERGDELIMGGEFPAVDGGVQMTPYGPMPVIMFPMHGLDFQAGDHVKVQWEVQLEREDDGPDFPVY